LTEKKSSTKDAVLSFLALIDSPGHSLEEYEEAVAALRESVGKDRDSRETDEADKAEADRVEAEQAEDEKLHSMLRPDDKPKRRA
jgi:hypothetical protein